MGLGQAEGLPTTERGQGAALWICNPFSAQSSCLSGQIVRGAGLGGL